MRDTKGEHAGNAGGRHRVLLQAALNGARTKADHPAVPIALEELTHDAVACVGAGAAAIHLHPRDPDGRERLDADVVDEVVPGVRNACGVPVGVTTGAWIEPELDRRLALVRAWRTPDYASVNLSEPGAVEVMQALIESGIGIEAGISSVEEAALLARSGLGNQITRILIEPVDIAVAEAIAVVDGIHSALDRIGLNAPRLQHGEGETAWILLADAVRRGIATRIGLEDTLDGPDGERTEGNEALVRAARTMSAAT